MTSEIPSGTTVPPSDAALCASYQVLARVLATESQMIWARTAGFIAVNGGAIAALQAFHGTLQPAIAVLLPCVGAIYAYLWHLTLRRAWAYHDMYIAQMREHEDALHLGQLGTYTFGKGPAESTLGGLSAKAFATVTTSVVITAYIALAVWSLCKAL